MNPFSRLSVVAQHHSHSYQRVGVRFWWTKTKIFAKTVFATCVLFGYGIPIANVLYYDTFYARVKKTKQKFGFCRPPHIFPFYFSRSELEQELIEKLEKCSETERPEITSKASIDESGKCMFVYGKPRAGKSIIFRHVLSKLGSGMLFNYIYSLNIV